MRGPDSPAQDTYEKLRNNIFGIDTSLSRTRAMALLLGSNFPDKHKVFESLLENEVEPWTIRYFAATSLGKLKTPEAKEVLNKNIQIKDERVLVGVMKSLAHVGDEHIIDAILDVKQRTTGFVASQAEFAAALISYRLGLQGNDLTSPPPPQDYLTTTQSKIQHMQISVAADQEIRKCLHSLANEQLGIVLAEKPAYQIYYDLGIGMVLFNKNVISEGNFDILLKRKVFLGVFADKILDSYSIAYLILTSPGGEHSTIDLLICSPDGMLNFVGTIKIGIKLVKFAIHSVADVGVIPILIEGSIKDKVLEIDTAKFSTKIQNKNQPHPIPH